MVEEIQNVVVFIYALCSHSLHSEQQTSASVGTIELFSILQYNYRKFEFYVLIAATNFSIFINCHLGGN